MRPSLSPRYATPVTQPFRPGQRPPTLALLPPIPLYRRLLRIHRKRLGPEERLFGDTYVKAEFRRHRDIENPLHIVGFLTQWQQYGQQLEGDDWKGEKLDLELLDKMSDQQLGQMYELMETIRKRARDSVDEEMGLKPDIHDGVGSVEAEGVDVPPVGSLSTYSPENKPSPDPEQGLDLKPKNKTETGGKEKGADVEGDGGSATGYGQNTGSVKETVKPSEKDTAGVEGDGGSAANYGGGRNNDGITKK